MEAIDLQPITIGDIQAGLQNASRKALSAAPEADNRPPPR
jgi:hypothetical protein